MVAMANLNIPDRAIRQQVASAVDLIVQVTRMADGTRKVTAISEITGMEGDVITMQDIFLFEKTGVGAWRQGDRAGSAPPASGRSAASGWPPSGIRCRWTCSSTCRWWRSDGMMLLTPVLVTFALVVGDHRRRVLFCSSCKPEQDEQSALRRRLKTGARRQGAPSTRRPAQGRHAAQHDPVVNAILGRDERHQPAGAAADRPVGPEPHGRRRCS